VGVAAIAAVAASIVAVAPAVVDRLPGGDGEVALNPAPGLNLAWADADYIYFGDHQTPRPNGLYDLTSVGGTVYFTTLEGQDLVEGELGRGSIYEWRPAEGGDPERVVGDAAGAAEVEGDLAAWLEAGGADRLRLHFTVGDTEYSSLTIPSFKNGPWVVMIAEGPAPAVIYDNGGEHYQWSWTGSESPTRLPVGETRFIDRASGVTAVQGRFTDPDFLTNAVHFRDAEGSEISRVGGVLIVGELNDAADRYLTQSGKWPHVPVSVDVATGEPTPLDIGRGNRGLGMAWDLDGNVTIAVSPKGEEPAPVDLVSCDPVDGSCDVIAQDVGEWDNVVLAGQTFGGL
jgi:hypothetical protein